MGWFTKEVPKRTITALLSDVAKLTDTELAEFLNGVQRYAEMRVSNLTTDAKKLTDILDGSRHD